MTNIIGYANPAGTNLGTITLEQLRTTDTDQAAARRLIQRRAPVDAHAELCNMLGIEPLRPWKE